MSLAIACSRSTCDYVGNHCDKGQVCAFVEKERAKCIPFAEATDDLGPPFREKDPFWCSQGGRSTVGSSHSFAGDIYAIDLASPIEGEVELVAPVAGTAHVFNECEERDTGAGAKNDSRCGLGYGNHVKIWDGTNIYLFGHLARVAIKPGRVERDQPLGTMGCSGAAGHRHVHVTVTHARPGEDLQRILGTPGHKGQTPVRFRFAARDATTGTLSSTWSETLPCAEERQRATLLNR